MEKKQNMYAYPLRLGVSTYAKIKKLAKENSRSINGQLEFMVRKYLQDYEQENGEIDIASTED